MDEPRSADAAAISGGRAQEQAAPPRLSRAALIAVAALTVLPVLHIAVYLAGYLVNVPWWDEYDESVALAVKAVTGSLTLRDLFMSTNGHVIFFTNVITVLSTYFLHWYVPLGSWISFGLTIVNLVILVDLLRRDAPRVAWVAAPVFSLLVFSIRQVFNWQFAFQTQWLFLLTWFLLGLWTLRTRPVGWRPLIAAAVFSLCATFSFSLGVLAWFVLAAVMGVMGYRRRGYFLVWALAAAAACGAYFWVRIPPSLPTTTDPLVLIQYSLILLGSPLVWGNTVIAALLAILVMGITAVNLVYLGGRMPLRGLAVWGALVVFALAAAVATAYGRAFFLSQHIDPIQPMEGRYVSVSMLLWIAAAALALMSLDRFAGETSPRWKKLLGRADVVFLGILLGAHLIVTVYFYQYPAPAPSLVQHWQVACLETYPQTGDQNCLQGLHPDKSVSGKGIEDLAKYHLALFADRP